MNTIKGKDRAPSNAGNGLSNCRRNKKLLIYQGEKAINYIIKNFVEYYPNLKDALCGDVIADGNTYFSKQIRNRLEKLDRGEGPSASEKKRNVEV